MLGFRNLRTMATSFLGVGSRTRRMPLHTAASFDEAVSRPSKISYGSNNENVECEKLLLEALKSPNRKLRVLTISGGGDNFMSMLAHPSVESVVCVDQNNCQLVLAQLKLAVACSDLTTEQALGFLGMNDSVNRVSVYEKVIEPLLTSEAAKTVRDDLMSEIQWGVVHFGSEANMFRYFNRKMAEAGFDKESLWNGTVDLEAFDRLCRSGIGTPDELAKAGRIDELVPRYLQIMDVAYQKAMVGLYNLVADTSTQSKTFMKSYTLREMYDEESLPEWLNPNVRPIIRQKKSHVSFVCSKFDEVPAADMKYDLVSPSNMLDWMEPEEAAASLQKIAEKFLSPNGYLLLRIGFGDTTEILKTAKDLRMCDKVTPEQLLEVERSLMMRNLNGLAALRFCS